MAEPRKKPKPKKKCCEKPLHKMCKRCPKRLGAAMPDGKGSCRAS